MNSGHPATRLDPGVTAAIEEEVGAAVNAKVASYWKATKFFLAGITFLFSVLFATGAITKLHLIRIAHDFVFGLEHSVVELLHERVAFSYSSEFWLSNLEGHVTAQSVAFYADDSQRVEALVEIKHLRDRKFFSHTPKVPLPGTLELVPHAADSPRSGGSGGPISTDS